MVTAAVLWRVVRRVGYAWLAVFLAFVVLPLAFPPEELRFETRRATQRVPVWGAPEVELWQKAFADSFLHAYVRDPLTLVRRHVCWLPDGSIPWAPRNVSVVAHMWSAVGDPAIHQQERPDYGVYSSPDGAWLALSYRGWFSCVYDRLTGRTISARERPPCPRSSPDFPYCARDTEWTVHVDRQIATLVGATTSSP